MYLLLNEKENIIVNTIRDLDKYDLTKYKVYGLTLLDRSELLESEDIRDAISKVLKGNQMPKDDVIDKVQIITSESVSKISKVITKMKKEKMIYLVDDLWDRNGKKWIGMVWERIGD